MANRTTQRKERSGITVSFALEEKKLIRRAAVETDSNSASDFIRQAAVKAAREALAA